MTIDSTDPNPYPTVTPIPYDPDDPEFTQPVEPLPPMDLEHLTAQEAIARQEAAAEAVVEAVIFAEPPEPPMVTAYKRIMQ